MKFLAIAVFALFFAVSCGSAEKKAEQAPEAAPAPLVAMDKEEIISTAREIGTYETSILPYDDCCVIFSPKHPLVRPEVEIERNSYSEMKIEDLLQKAVDEAQEFEITYHV